MAPIATVGVCDEEPSSHAVASTSVIPVFVPVGPCAPLLVVTVGPPARGKSIASRRAARTLNWKGYSTKVVIVDDEVQDSQKSIMEALALLQTGTSVVILDGCHITFSSRKKLSDICSELSYRILFVQFICDDPNILEKNILEIFSFKTDSYRSREEGLTDIKEKMAYFTDRFEPLKETEGAFIQVQITQNGPIICSKGITGCREKEVQSVVSSSRPKEQVFYLSRHGESEYNVLGRIGGNADLSPRGRRYADRLAHYANQLVESGGLKSVWTSELQRTKHTAKDIKVPQEHLQALNEINAGICEGLTYEEIQEQYPQEFAWRDQDKLNYRYPWGESYLDIMSRLNPVLTELESTSETLLVSHQAVLRAVLGFFMDCKMEELPYISVPLHTIIKVTASGYKYSIEKMSLNVDCVDTNRKQPKNCSINRTSDDALGTVPSHYDALPPWQSMQAV